MLDRMTVLINNYAFELSALRVLSPYSMSSKAQQ